MSVVGVQDTEGNSRKNHGEVEKQRGGNGLLYRVLSDDAILEVVEVEGESPEEVLANAFANVIPLGRMRKFNTITIAESHQASLTNLYVPVVLAAAVAAVVEAFLVGGVLVTGGRPAAQPLAEARLLVLREHGRRALDHLLELGDRGDSSEVVPEADVAEERGERPRRLEGRLGLLDLARAEDEDEEADLLGVLAEVAAVLQARDAHVPLLQRRHRDRPAEPSLWVNDQ